MSSDVVVDDGYVWTVTTIGDTGRIVGYLARVCYRLSAIANSTQRRCSTSATTTAAAEAAGSQRGS